MALFLSFLLVCRSAEAVEEEARRKHEHTIHRGAVLGPNPNKEGEEEEEEEEEEEGEEK